MLKDNCIKFYDCMNDECNLRTFDFPTCMKKSWLESFPQTLPPVPVIKNGTLVVRYSNSRSFQSIFCSFRTSVCLDLGLTLGWIVRRMPVPFQIAQFRPSPVLPLATGLLVTFFSWFCITFLGATKHLYNWLCPSVGRSVCWVTHSFDDPHVAPYWPTRPCYYIALCRLLFASSFSAIFLTRTPTFLCYWLIFMCLRRFGLSDSASTPLFLATDSFSVLSWFSSAIIYLAGSSPDLCKCTTWKRCNKGSRHNTSLQ